MTDVSNTTSHVSQSAKTTKTPHNEYRFYFGLIFLLGLPICTFSWVYSMIRHQNLPSQSPIRAAWSEAQSITPRIFWG